MKHVVTFGNSWTHLVTFGHIWTHLETFGRIWINLNRFGQIWPDLDRFEQIRKDLNTFGRFFFRPSPPEAASGCAGPRPLDKAVLSSGRAGARPLDEILFFCECLAHWVRTTPPEPEPEVRTTPPKPRLVQWTSGVRPADQGLRTTGKLPNLY